MQYLLDLETLVVTLHKAVSWLIWSEVAQWILLAAIVAFLFGHLYRPKSKRRPTKSGKV